MRILILGGSRSDAWNASVRTRGTAAARLGDKVVETAIKPAR